MVAPYRATLRSGRPTAVFNTLEVGYFYALSSISNERSKGKNATVLLPEVRLVLANALSNEMGVSHRLEVCDTPAPTPEEVQILFKVCSVICLPVKVSS